MSKIMDPLENVKPIGPYLVGWAQGYIVLRDTRTGDDRLYWERSSANRAARRLIAREAGLAAEGSV